MRGFYHNAIVSNKTAGEIRMAEDEIDHNTKQWNFTSTNSESTSAESMIGGWVQHNIFWAFSKLTKINKIIQD